MSQDFKFGVKGGGNLSSLGTENDVIEKQTRVGYHLGFAGSLDQLNFGIQLEAWYSTQGAEISLPNLVYEEQYDYLTIPLALKFYTNKKFNVHFGPSLSILINATQRETTGLDKSEYDISEFISSTDYGFFAGIGYDISDPINIEIRYNYGMKDVDSQANIERRNRLFQISMYYFFINK